MKNVSVTIGICCALLLGVTQLIYAHGSDRFHDGDHEHVDIYAPVKGALEFYAVVSEHERFMLGKDQYDMLEKISHLLKYQTRFEKGIDCDADMDIAQSYRQKCDDQILKLADSMPGLVTLDFTDRDSINYDKVIELAGQYLCVLLKVVNGDGVSEFRIKNINLQTAIEPGIINLAIADNGTTFILINFDEVPTDTFRLIFSFRKDSEGSDCAWAAVSFAREKQGHLSLKINDEQGLPITALVRLIALDSGEFVKPANAVDYSDVMLSLVPTQVHSEFKTFYCYTLNDFKGPFWVTPGAFEMALPAGNWQVEIYRGIENVSVRESFEIKSGQWTKKVCTLTRWTDMSKLGWYSGDDHVHARMQNSNDAGKLSALAKATDTRILNILEMGNHDRTWFTQRGFGKDFRVEDDGYYLVPGQEDPRSQMGHAIGLNITSLARDTENYLLNDLVADEIHRQGGLYGHTHVGEKAFEVYRDMAMLIPRGKSDFNSILQIHLGTDYYYDFLNLGYKLTASAGSDTPYGGVLGLVRVYAYTGEDAPFTPDKWFDAVKKGRTFVTNGPMLEFTVNGAMPGDELVFDDNERVSIKAKAWGQSGNSAPVLLEVIKSGEPVKQVAATEAGQASLEIEMQLDCEYGFWIALHAVGQNSSEAHTTPVYVTRKGFRHWNIDKAQVLIDSGLKIIDEIEQMVTEAQEKLDAGQIAATDRWSSLPAANADKLRDRTKIVRQYYLDLQAELEKEKKLRTK